MVIPESIENIDISIRGDLLLVLIGREPRKNQKKNKKLKEKY